MTSVAVRSSFNSCRVFEMYEKCLQFRSLCESLYMYFSFQLSFPSVLWNSKMVRELFTFHSGRRKIVGKCVLKFFSLKQTRMVVHLSLLKSISYVTDLGWTNYYSQPSQFYHEYSHLTFWLVENFLRICFAILWAHFITHLVFKMKRLKTC